MVLLRLWEKWVLNATSLSDLFTYPFDHMFSKEIANELDKCQGHKLLLVLDGFDEVSHSFHENSVIKSILCRQLLPEYTIILTTRPGAKSTLETICQPEVDKHVEIIGFREEEIVRYITRVLSKKPKLQKNFLKYMFLVPYIKSMMYIPLNCAIIAQVYYESQNSRRLAIPRTRTQLYKALTHSLLFRHMNMHEGNCDYTSTLPEGLNIKFHKLFEIIAKFAFESYHKTELRKGEFFKEDIPEGLVHFGFMNESTEMYASKGVEQTFSFLHFSLQEYLAAWHLANSYSIEFQVAYHWLAVDGCLMYKGDNKEEAALLSSLKEQRSSLEEPAIFLAGITGWGYQSVDDRNHWEIYLSHDTAQVQDPSVLLRSLYEAQNSSLLQPYFAAGSNRRKVIIGSLSSSSNPFTSIFTAYDCYAFLFSLSNFSDKFMLSVQINKDDDVSLIEALVKGLEDHCKIHKPEINILQVKLGCESEKISNTILFWLIRANCWSELKEIVFESQSSINSKLACVFFSKLQKLELLYIKIGSQFSWKWLAKLEFLNQLKAFNINNKFSSSEGEYSEAEAVLDIDFFPTTLHDLHTIDNVVHSLLKSVKRSIQIVHLLLSNLSRGTMAGVHSILLHCPSLISLELKRTRLGYDGILYICSALRTNTTLTHLIIHDDHHHLKPLSIQQSQITSFTSMERVPQPSKSTTTDFLLELNNILKDNTTLKEMNIRSGLFLPLSPGEDGEYCQWTGLRPLQQFNVGAVASGMSPNLRRSFSSSDLTRPQTLLLWKRQFTHCYESREVDFNNFFSELKKKGKNIFSLSSFTAPGTDFLQFFSGLDPRLKECLQIPHLNQYYVENLRDTCWDMLGEVACKMSDKFAKEGFSLQLK